MSSNNYIDNEKFYNEIVKWKEKCAEALAKGEEKPRLTNYLGDCIQKIATKMSYAPNFLNYSFREEMIGDGIETCLKYFDNYDPSDPMKNPFGYFSMVVWRCFVQRIGLEEKNRYIIYKNFEKSMIHGGQAELLVDDENNLIPGKLYDNIQEFIRNYEAKEEKKKQKRIAKKRAKELENDKISSSCAGSDSRVDEQGEGPFGISLYEEELLR